MTDSCKHANNNMIPPEEHAYTDNINLNNFYYRGIHHSLLNSTYRERGARESVPRLALLT